MLRTFCIFIGLVVLLGAGVAVAAWPHGGTTLEPGFPDARQLAAAYARVRNGVTRASQLEQIGFDTGAARRLSYLALVEKFMPRDSTGFDAMAPALQGCFAARDNCTAYIFHADDSTAEAVLLIQGGRVAWKTLAGPGAASGG